MRNIPPLNQTDWIELFNKYKQTPEFQKINSDYTLKDFKFIFFWEYLHRMIGRLLGVVFILPFLYFLIKKRLNKKLIQQSLVLFSLGALQATIGWWMVKSGLVDRPDVSHYRLSTSNHEAFNINAYSMGCAPTNFKKKNIGNHKVLRYLMFLSLIVIIQIIYGAFVAGLKAGLALPNMAKKWEKNLFLEKYFLLTLSGIF